MSLASSAILTASPISNTKISPPLPIKPACITNCTASGIDIKKRVISGCVTVTGPPLAICSRNLGITLPLLPNTLPKRTITKCVADFAPPSKLWQTISAKRLLAPITLVGFTALSVEISTNRSTFACIAALASTCVPSTLLDKASATLCVSIKGTCLYAAA